VQALAGFLKNNEFKPANAPEGEPLNPELVVSDSRTSILLHGTLSGDAAEDAGLLARAEPVKHYGPSMFRLQRADALLVQVLLGARAGFDVPFIEWVDLRELVLSGENAQAIQARAKIWKLERALYAAMQVVSKLFPETATAAGALAPELPLPVRKVLDVSVVEPVSVIGRSRTSRSGEVLRALLSTG
jgi:hypothetical protein